MIVRGETVLMQHLVQQYAGMVACERSSGPICAMHARCESNDQEARIGGAKWRHRAAIIVRILGIDAIEKGRESRAFTTIFVKQGVDLQVLYPLM
jgi:hypothetical protein